MRPKPTGKRIGNRPRRGAQEGRAGQRLYLSLREACCRNFKRDFPGINVVAVTGRGNELTNRIMAERRAGKFIADVYSGGTNSLYNTLYKGKALDPLKPLLSIA